LDNTYLKFVLMAPEVRQQIEARATGSTVRGIRQSELRQVLIPVPRIELQRQFARRVAVIERVRGLCHTSSVQLDALFAALQHQAFNEGLGR
jgi:type I restriction enzyme S subunit